MSRFNLNPLKFLIKHHNRKSVIGARLNLIMASFVKSMVYMILGMNGFFSHPVPMFWINREDD